MVLIHEVSFEFQKYTIHIITVLDKMWSLMLKAVATIVVGDNELGGGRGCVCHIIAELFVNS